MRKRVIKKQFWLSEEECNALKENSAKAGLKECVYVRKLLLGYQLKEKPDERFYEAIKVIRGLSNNMNQISKKAHSLGFIDEALYRSNWKKINDFMEEIIDVYLRNERNLPSGNNRNLED